MISFDQILDKFATDLTPLLAKDYLRSLRYIALLLPTADLSQAQFDRIMLLLHPDGVIASSIRTNGSVDVFYSYMLRRIAKGNRDLIAGFDWSSWADLVFDHVLPSALKIPSPFKGALKLGKFIPRGEQGHAGKIYECLEDNVAINVAKWAANCLIGSIGIDQKLQFTLSSLKNLVHPSNHGSWVAPIEVFLMAFSGSCATLIADELLQATSIEELVDSVWLLVEKLVFSKSGTGTTGNFSTCIIGKYLANIDPIRIVPRILELVSSSLDSLTEPHRTTSAIGMLCLCMTSVLNFAKTPAGIAPTVMLLPTIAQGIDSNDQMKSIFTFALLSNLATSTRIEDVSDCRVSGQDDWNDDCQLAKEATSQFPDIALLFTENLISYLRAYDSGSESAHAGLDPTIGKLILAVSETFYGQLSDSILQLCTEKWIDYFWSDCSLSAAEIIGEVLSLSGRANPKLLDVLIAKIVGRIEEQISKGAGAMGSLPQANRTILCNLTVVLCIFERFEPAVIANVTLIKRLFDLLNNSVTNKQVYDKCSSLMNVCIVSLFTMRTKAIQPETCDHPLSNWGKWTSPEEMKASIDYEWISPSEQEVCEAVNILASQIGWIETRVAQLQKESLESKSTVEGLHCCLLSIESLGDCAQKILSTFGAQDCGFNSQLCNQKHFEDGLVALGRLGNVLVGLISVFSSQNSNVELSIAFANVVGKFVDNRGTHPTRTGSVINSFSRLGIYLKRHPKDKTRPALHFLKLVSAYRSFRRDHRSIFGDSKTFSVLEPIESELTSYLLESSFSLYRGIRMRCQSAIFHYTSTYPQASEGLLTKVFNKMESVCQRGSITEHVLKGFCFLIQFQLCDLITENPEYFSKFSRLITSLNERPEVQALTDSVATLQAACRRVTEALVPSAIFNCQVIKDLTVDLLKLAESSSEWTTQMMALGCTEAVFERVGADSSLFASIASLMTSRVRSCRHLANTIFCMAVFDQGMRVKSDIWRYKSVTAQSLLDGQVIIERPDQVIYQVDEAQKQAILQHFREMIRLNSLEDGNESDGPQQVNSHQVFIYSLLLICLGPDTIAELLQIVEEAFFVGFADGKIGKLEDGKQKTFAEFAIAIILTAPSFSDAWWPKLKGLLLGCWRALPLEQSSLWTSSTGSVLSWRAEFFAVIHEFFYGAVKSGSTVSLVIAMRMLSSAVKEAGPLAAKLVLVSPPELLSLFSHEYSLIGTEASRLMAHLQIILPAGQREGRIDCLMDELQVAVLTESEKPRFYKSLLQFLANCSTAPNYSGFWMLLSKLLPSLIAVLEIDNVQLLADTKKALIALVLGKRCPVEFIQVHLPGAISAVLPKFPAKTRKFLLEILQLCLQANYSLFSDLKCSKKLLKSFNETFVNSAMIDVREASLGLMLTLYQINPEIAEFDAVVLTGSLERYASTIKSENSFAARHSVVIRSGAIVLSDPYTIKPHLPGLLSALSRFISDKNPIGPLVRTTFGEFRRTHMETWSTDRQLFTDDQLDAIGELLVAPSYYA